MDRDSLRRYLSRCVVCALRIERKERGEDPIAQMDAVLQAAGDRIRLLEGRRKSGEAKPLPFKSRLYHLAAGRTELPWVLAWIDLHRVLPKGKFLPIPLLCTVRFGIPWQLAPGEDKAAFREPARAALLALKPVELPRE